MAEILLFSDDVDLLAQLFSLAAEVAAATHWEVAAYGPLKASTGSADSLKECDVAGGCVQALTKMASANEARLLLIGATKLGREVAPRVAERLGAAYASWATGVEVDTSTARLTASCILYAGVGEAKYLFEGDKVVLTVGDGMFDAAEDVTAVIGVSCDPGELGPSVDVIRSAPKLGHANTLEHTRLVVDCGKGVSTLEDLEQAKSLARLLGGNVACSRPLASDRDWFSDWLGLSGAKVKPDLCFAVGISGSVQHVIGIRGAGLIVAVNTDEDAPIFTQADFGVIADLHEFLPALIKRIHERGVHPVWNAVEAPATSPPSPTPDKEV